MTIKIHPFIIRKVALAVLKIPENPCLSKNTVCSCGIMSGKIDLGENPIFVKSETGP